MKVYLTGGRSGQDFTYQHKYVFVGGMLEIGNDEVNLLTFLRKSLQVRTEYEPRPNDGTGDIPVAGKDSAGVANSNSGLSTEVGSTGTSVTGGDRLPHEAVEGNPEGLLPNGAGSANVVVDPYGQKLRSYISKLDCKDDNNWRADGSLKVAAVSDVFPRITSAELKTIAADLNRVTVRQLQANTEG